MDGDTPVKPQRAVKPKIKAVAARTKLVPATSIAPAEYNPRRISPVAEQKLRTGMQKFGLVEPLVWNERSGRLVGGHQRFRQLLLDHGWRDGQPFPADLMVPVTAVDHADADEKALNVLLNNYDAQGEWDYDLLGKMLEAEADFSLQDAGIDVVALQSIPELDKYDLDHVLPTKVPVQGGAEIGAIKEARKGHKDDTNAFAQSAGDGTVSLVFGAGEAAVAAADAFVRACGFTDGQRIVDGFTACEMLKVDVGVADSGTEDGSGEVEAAAEDVESPAEPEPPKKAKRGKK